jgi:N-acetylglucosamine malate deacetylase 1
METDARSIGRLSKKEFTNETSRMLVIAPHPDDEILGVGGTMTRFAQAGGSLTILTVAAHMPPLFTESVHQQIIAEARKAHTCIGVSESIFMNNPAVLLDNIPLPDFNKSILDVVNRVKPHILLLPFYDRHVDHRLIFNAAMVAARPIGVGKSIQLVAAYETLSETHWNAPHIEPNFTPNWVVDITDTIDAKLQAMNYYKSQVHPFPAPRSIEALKALALFRGSQAGFAYGEGFHIIRMTAPPEGLISSR